MSNSVKVTFSCKNSNNDKNSNNYRDTNDGKMVIFYIYGNENNKTSKMDGDLNYIKIGQQSELVQSKTWIITYDKEYGVPENTGVIFDSSSDGGSCSIYRREYSKYRRKLNGSEQVMEFTGNWEPVAINAGHNTVIDYNISSGKTYQYIMYPNSITAQEQFANTTDVKTNSGYVDVKWDEWSISELVPENNNLNIPLIKKIYRVDYDNVWLFKYSLETGAQNHNFVKNEIQTLGQYSRIGHGKNNYISGTVNCLLGSEIIPGWRDTYIERTSKSIEKPLSTNDKIYMLQKWRELASSKNPKLLKDIKGQSWIVQIMENSNTPHNTYKNQPDIISFSWKQIEDVENVVIYGDDYNNALYYKGKYGSVWEKNNTNEE